MFVARLDGVERAIIIDLLSQVRELLGGDHPAQPARAGDHPAQPARGGDHPAQPAHGGDHPAQPGGANDQPEERASDDFESIVSGLTDVASLIELDGGMPVPRDARSFGNHDPALGRLLPVGNRTDEQSAAEYRRLTEQSLRQRKAAHLSAAITALHQSGDAVRLDEEQATHLVVALTDVRLVLGERLGLRTDEDAERLSAALERAELDDPRAAAMGLYDFLTWLQETLAAALMPR